MSAPIDFFSLSCPSPVMNSEIDSCSMEMPQ